VAHEFAQYNDDVGFKWAHSLARPPMIRKCVLKNPTLPGSSPAMFTSTMTSPGSVSVSERACRHREAGC
jgi:hypothetical protein